MENGIISKPDGIIVILVSLNPTVTSCYYFLIRPLKCWPPPEIRNRNHSCLSSSCKQVVILRDCSRHVVLIVLYNLLEFDV